MVQALHLLEFLLDYDDDHRAGIQVLAAQGHSRQGKKAQVFCLLVPQCVDIVLLHVSAQLSVARNGPHRQRS